MLQNLGARHAGGFLHLLNRAKAHRVPSQPPLDDLLHPQHLCEGEGAPADAERRMDIRPRKPEDRAQLFPVGHLFEWKLLHWGPGDDQAVKGPLADGVLKRYVILVHMGRIAALVGVVFQPDPDRFDLDDGPPERVQKMEFVALGLGHHIDDADAQRADIRPLCLFRGEQRHPAFQQRRAAGVL